MKRIYLDYASLTPIDSRVIREVKKYSSDKYANPSSLYKEGVAAKKALEKGRRMVADFLHAHSDEIVFTSGGTEANGLALEGVSRAARRSGIAKPHLIISAIEHSSIMEMANMLEKHDVEVTRLSVNSSGVVSLDELKKAIKQNTFLVSIMMVNNEVGTIQPIHEALKIVRQARKAKATANAGSADPKYPLFHTDAAQALYSEINIESLGIDLLTLDGTKVYGPRGIGCLYIRRDTPIEPIIYGGGQERGMRSGTENVPAIMGFVKALEIVKHEVRSKEKEKIAQLRSLFIEKLRAVRPDMIVNGGEGEQKIFSKQTSMRPASLMRVNGTPHESVEEMLSASSPHILNVSIPGIDNEFFVLQLDARGIACSTKSSCLRDLDESYVLKAMGVDSKTSIRFSFGRWTIKRDIIKAITIIKSILHRS